MRGAGVGNGKKKKSRFRGGLLEAFSKAFYLGIDRFGVGDGCGGVGGVFVFVSVGFRRPSMLFVVGV